MQFFYLLLIFIFGTCIGSFINVVAERVHRNEKLTGRSHCEFCNKTLHAKDLVPLLSFLYLKRQCRYCKKQLPVQYFLVEVVTGIIFVIIYQLTTNNLFVQADQLNNIQHIMEWGVLIPLIFFYLVTTSLIILFITDLKYGMLYDKILIPTIIFVLIYKFSVVGYYYLKMYLALNNTQIGKYFLKAGLASNHAVAGANNLMYTLLGSLAIAAFFLVLIIITRGRGMGGGDLKLGFLIGLLSGWPNMLISIFLGFLTGALVSCILLVVRRRKMGQTIPFGPFLIIGCFTVMFFGNQLFGWYIQDILGLQ